MDQIKIMRSVEDMVCSYNHAIHNVKEYGLKYLGVVLDDNVRIGDVSAREAIRLAEKYDLNGEYVEEIRLMWSALQENLSEKLSEHARLN